MRLETLIRAAAAENVLQWFPGLEITGLSVDSRKTGPGHLFAALPGVNANGTQFARQAAEKGAVAILTEQKEALTHLPQLVVKDARAAMARIANEFYGQPAQKMRVGAVTGTNGKSTTAFLVRHLLRASQARCGLLGTIEYDLGKEVLEAPLTTPESIDLFAYLRAMADCKCAGAIMEVSSHSLSQHRVEGIDFAAAAFTNLTQDHLDYHRTMENYRDAKGLLFAGLSKKATAVLNFDDPVGEYYARRTHAEVLGFSMKKHKKAELRAQVVSMDIHGTTFTVQSPWGSREVRWGMVGAHNIQNALAALGTSLALGCGDMRTFSFDNALSALERFRGVPGRLEPVGDGIAPFRVLVDYAHTDDALRNVMNAMRALRPSRLIVVFGCGGDRDRTKRPRMGRVVEEMADLGVVTSDNPRTEDPAAIIGEIWAGIQRQQKFTVEQDRAKAIDFAIREARPGDVVLIAGKGHENYQIVGTKKNHFDDREEALAALERKYGGGMKSAAAAGND
ncbi:MAG: UDP-N-acetylmuramoyl-L-alanyl-D-glutamate--2,6-diaminopimelate ligase [Planctomycetota bacterium]|nr:UDP-N-acetylmuramoyl-L-alanyl-D-glutamate--2,6-diaminopimelate ligase [Planctomycetota bacterium]